MVLVTVIAMAMRKVLLIINKKLKVFKSSSGIDSSSDSLSVSKSRFAIQAQEDGPSVPN